MLLDTNVSIYAAKPETAVGAEARELISRVWA